MTHSPTSSPPGLSCSLPLPLLCTLSLQLPPAWEKGGIWNPSLDLP